MYTNFYITNVVPCIICCFELSGREKEKEMIMAVKWRTVELQVQEV